MAELTGWAMSTVVNWFMILIIFVFDPLAIGMIVAANMSFSNIKGVARDPKDYEVYLNKEHIEDDVIVTPEIEEKIKLENNLEDEGEELKNLTYPEFVEKHYNKEEIIEKIPTLPPQQLKVNIEVEKEVIKEIPQAPSSEANRILEEMQKEKEETGDPEFIKKYEKFINNLKNNNIKIPKRFQ